MPSPKKINAAGPKVIQLEAVTLRKTLLVLALRHAKELAHAGFENDFGRCLPPAVKPVFEVFDFYGVRYFRLPDLDCHSCESFAQLTHPFVPAHGRQGLAHSFVKRSRRNVERMSDVVEIVDGDSAGSKRIHASSLSCSPFVRYSMSPS